MRPSFRALIALLTVAASIALAACGTGRGLVLNQLLDARTLTADARVAFVKAADKSNQAVMADTDETSAMAAHEAQDARGEVETRIERLRALLASLGYTDEMHSLDTFATAYTEYKTLDDTILDLAIENSNLKAQRVALGPGQDAVDAVSAALDTTVSHAPPRLGDRAQMLSERAKAALLETQVIETRHIAESDAGRMTQMETRMTALTESAQNDIDALRHVVPPATARYLAPATDALGKFTTAHTQLVQLSRRNTNVRSLALTLGRKRTLTAACEDALTALADGLSRHQLAGTR